MRIYSYSNLKSATVLAVTSLILIFQFNNCSEKINSQMVDSSLNLASTAPGGGNTNPYVLQCLDSSDGSVVSQSLLKMIEAPMPGQSTNKISSLDWDQSVDLILNFDVECLILTNFSDPVLSYVNSSAINREGRSSALNVKKEDVLNLDAFVKAVLDSECVKSAEPNFEVKIASTDTYAASQTHLASPSAYSIGATDSLFGQINAYVTNANYAANDHIVKVAVIDTGIDGTNPDLAPVLARDGQTYLGENTSGSGALTAFLTDSGWHGTHVAGLIAAKYDNGFGVTGVAGRNVALYPFKASSNGSTFTIAALTQAIEKAVAYDVDIINMSVGTTTNSSTLREAIFAAMADHKITFVAAAGNGNASGTGQVLTNSFPVYPAMYSSDANGLITVGSLDLVTQTISGFSNRSNIYVDLLAPGSNSTGNLKQGILSTIPLSYNQENNLGYLPYNGQGPGVGSLIDKLDGTASVVQGTSMAAPIVTGALANIISMVKSRGKTIEPNQLKTWLRGAGSKKETGFANYSVSGNYLNLQKLVDHAIAEIPNLGGGQPPTPGPQPPTPTPVLEITQQPLPKQAVVSETITLSVRTSNNTGLSYQWYKNGVVVSGATSQDLVLSNIQTSQAGSYKVGIKETGTALPLFSNSVNVLVGLGYCK